MKVDAELYALALNVLESCQSYNLIGIDKVSALRIALSGLRDQPGNGGVREIQYTIAIDNHVQEIHHSIVVLTSIASKARASTSNYFGLYDASIYANEINMMADHLQLLIACATSMQPYEYTHMDVGSSHSISSSAAAAAAAAASDNIAPTDSIRCSNFLFLKVFWLKHFQWVAAIDWLEFRRQFEQEYGIQHDYAMDAFYQAVCAGCIAMPARSVSFDQLQTLFAVSFSSDGSSNYNATLFDIYQIHADPDSMIAIAGRVMEHTLDYPTPTIVRELLGLVIKSVSCGSRFVCVLISTGQIYSWGCGKYGQLGHGDRQDQLCPKLLEFSTAVRIAQVVCGSGHTGAVSTTGEVYSWGYGWHGTLGIGVEEGCYPSPRKVPGLDAQQVKSFHAGQYHSCVLLANGHVYSFGKARYAGHSSRANQHVLVPTQLDAFVQHPASQIAIGSGAYHTLVLTLDGKLFAWGDIEYGQLGLPDERNDVQLPREVPNVPNGIKQVATGTFHSCLVTDEGELYVCGRNDSSQLGFQPVQRQRGITTQSSFIPLQDPLLRGKNIRNVVCGGWHTMLLCDAYDVNGMGHNAYCQRGATDNKGATAGPSNVQYFQEQMREVLQVSCGMYFTAYVLGSTTPASLRKLCSDRIRSHAELTHLILGGATIKQLRKQGISKDYAEIVRSMLV